MEWGYRGLELRKKKDVYGTEGKFPPQKKNIMGSPVKVRLKEPYSPGH